MKKITLLAATAAFTFAMTACGGGEKKAEEAAPAADATTEVEMKSFSVDAAASSVQWKGTMMKMYSHSGTVAVKEGNLDWKGKDLVGGKFVIDMGSVTPTDTNYSEEHTAEQLIGHLGTADFFDVANNPTASFEITGSDMAAGTVMGNLTVRGKTNVETVSNVVFDEATGAASGVLTFNRQNYDVAYASTMKDMVLSDDIELTILLMPTM